MLLNEQMLLAGLLYRAGGGPGWSQRLDTAELRALRAANARRLVELKQYRALRVAMALRAVARHAPAPLRESLRRFLPQPAQTPKSPLAAETLPVDLRPPSLNEPVAVVMHMHYPELAAEMRAYLENIPGPVDLFASTDTPENAERLHQAYADWGPGKVEVRVAPNRGRDIAPKLVAFRDVYMRYAVTLHLHSKRSIHTSYQRLWRYFLLESLIGDRDRAARALSAFEHEADLGMISPGHYFAVRNNITWGPNFRSARELAERMGFALDPAALVDFPSGSMFWARSAALKPLLDLHIREDDFPVEAGQIDGTLAHAIERLYFLVCRAAGYRWVKIDDPFAQGLDGLETPQIEVGPATGSGGGRR